MKPQTIMLSLDGPVGLLREEFRQSAIVHGLQPKHSPDNENVLNALYYDVNPYMTKLIEEIFMNEDRPEYNGKPSPSTQILLNDGLDDLVALELGLSVFRYTISEIAAMIPDIEFGNNGEWQYGFAEGDILMITRNPFYVPESD